MIHTKVLSKNVSLLKDLTVCFLASIIMGLLSKIYIPLLFTPVPLTLQTAMIFFLSAYFGSRKAAFTILLYLLEGLLGCPVFASGICGISAFFLPATGYLFGFLISAYVIGLLLEKNILRLTNAFLVGNFIIYICGIAWLSYFIGWKMAVIGGMLPFIPGDLIKIFATVKLLEKFGIYSDR